MGKSEYIFAAVDRGVCRRNYGGGNGNGVELGAVRKNCIGGATQKKCLKQV